MLKDRNNQIIFAIAFCEICKEFMLMTNERTASLDAERKIGIHAATKHGYIKDKMGWTNNEHKMSQIRRNPWFKEGYL